jgi:hypothetical protein
MTDMCAVCDAIEDVIGAADPVKRNAVVRAIDTFARHNPQAYGWIANGMPPAVLTDLMSTIDTACREGAGPKATLHLIKGIPPHIGTPGAKAKP